MPSIEEPRLKIEWAKRHLAKLQEEFSDWLGTKPYEIITEQGEGDLAPLYVFKLRIYRPMPKRVSLRMGDFIQCLRTSLDQTVWQLSLFTRPELNEMLPEEWAVRSIQFPILEMTNAALLQRNLGAVEPDPRRQIENLQPHLRTDPKSDWLWVLSRLSNRDKHRNLIPVGFVVATSYIPTNGGQGLTFRLSGPFEDDQIVGVVPRAFVDSGQFTVQVAAASQVLFEEGGPEGVITMESLDRLYEYVSDRVFASLCAYFPA